MASGLTVAFFLREGVATEAAADEEDDEKDRAARIAARGDGEIEV
jgi:hypothetical protein